MADFLSDLLYMSVLGSLLAGFLFLLRMLFQRRVGQAVFYYLWILVLLRLCVPIRIMVSLPGTGIGLFNVGSADVLLEKNSGEVLSGQAKHVGGNGSQQKIINDGIEIRQKESAANSTQTPTKHTVNSVMDGVSLVMGSIGSVLYDILQSAHDVINLAVNNTLNFAMFRIMHLSGQNISVWWIGLWGIGVAVSLFWYIGSYLHFLRTVRRTSFSSEKLTEKLIEALPQTLTETSLEGLSPLKIFLEAQAILKQLDLAGKVQLAVSSSIDTPMLLGVRHPVIVLPESIDDKRHLKNIVIHELMHAKRHDLIYKWFTVVVTSLHWFNPLMILVRREIGRLCELSCDEAVVRGMDYDGRKHYGETLLDLAAVPSGRHSMMTTTFCREKNQLRERLVFIVRYRKKGKAAILISLLLILVVGGCAFVFGADDVQESLDGPESEQIESGQGKSVDGSESGQGESVDGLGLGQGESADGSELVQNDFLDGPETEKKESSGGLESVRKNKLDIYRKILQGKSQFFYVKDEHTIETVHITDVPKIFSPDSSYAAVDRFAVVDLDNDGEQEVVMQVIDVAGDMGGYMTLHQIDGQVYGYASNYKTFELLKADGTYGCSSLAATDQGAEEGICRSRFTRMGCVTEWLIYCAMDKYWEPVSYTVNQQPADEEDYAAAMKQQKAKPDAVWYEFTDNGIHEVFLTGSQGLMPEYYSFSVRVSESRVLTVALDTAQPEEEYFAVDRILVYDGTKLLQTIETTSLPKVEDYAWDGLFVCQQYAVGEPDIRDLNFDGAEDFGLLAVQTFPKNVPYSYFVWNEDGQCFDYAFTRFVTLEVDEKNQLLIERCQDNARYTEITYYDLGGNIVSEEVLDKKDKGTVLDE